MVLLQTSDFRPLSERASCERTRPERPFAPKPSRLYGMRESGASGSVPMRFATGVSAGLLSCAFDSS